MIHIADACPVSHRRTFFKHAGEAMALATGAFLFLVAYMDHPLEATLHKRSEKPRTDSSLKCSKQLFEACKVNNSKSEI